MRISPLCPEKAKSPAPRILTRSRLADRRTGRAGGLWSSFHRKRPHKFSKQVGLRLVTCCAFSHVKHAMAICSTLPAYSDRIARELHPIPSNQTESGHLLKTYMKEL